MALHRLTPSVALIRHPRTGAAVQVVTYSGAHELELPSVDGVRQKFVLEFQGKLVTTLVGATLDEQLADAEVKAKAEVSARIAEVQALVLTPAPPPPPPGS